MRSRAYGLLAVVGLALASCGSDKRGESSVARSASVEPPAAIQATTVGATSPADAARAKRGLLRLSDFPPGWRADTANKRKTCGQYLDGLKQTAEQRSAFTRQDEDNVDSVVRMFATEQEAKTALGRLDSDPLRSCYEREITKRVGSISEVRSGQVRVGEVKVGALSSERYGDDSAALQIVVPLVQGQIETDLYADSIFVQRDRALLIANFATQDSEFDAELMTQLLEAATARLAP